ncbi:MAG: hypothetical protein LCH61_13825 [Proteobacteria bacterium]|nr:hypothetical protein [Pseudomonadota bacterium]
MTAQAMKAESRIARVRVVPKRAHETIDDFFMIAPVLRRREAEIMFEIDAAQSGKSKDWTAYFVESMVEFLVFGSRPTGRISPNDAAWLMTMVGEHFSPSVPELFRALILQTEEVPSSILQYAMKCGAMRGVGSSLV